MVTCALLPVDVAVTPEDDKSFKNWIDESKFKKLYWSEDFQQFTRVIVLCSDVDSLVLSDGYSK